MDETIQILIATLSGFIIAFMADPVKESILGFFKRRKIRLALYKEMMNNYYKLAIFEKNNGDSSSKEEDNDIDAFAALIYVEKEYYDYVKKNEITEFYLLKEASTITSIYRLIGELVDEEPKFGNFLFPKVKEKDNTTTDPSKFKLRKLLMREYPIQFREFIESNKLDKKYMYKIFGKDKVNKILDSTERLKSFKQK
jgi:hypothetical protein